jgi:hypothetical protein
MCENLRKLSHHFASVSTTQPWLQQNLQIYLGYLEISSSSAQWWANLDQASKHLEVFRFRDLSPTPIP